MPTDISGCWTLTFPLSKQEDDQQHCWVNKNNCILPSHQPSAISIPFNILLPFSYHPYILQHPSPIWFHLSLMFPLNNFHYHLLYLSSGWSAQGHLQPLTSKGWGFHQLQKGIYCNSSISSIWNNRSLNGYHPVAHIKHNEMIQKDWLWCVNFCISTDLDPLQFVHWHNRSRADVVSLALHSTLGHPDNRIT